MEEWARAPPFARADHLERSVLFERPQEDLVTIFIGQGMMKDRGRDMRHRLEDDRLAVGTEIPLARSGQAITYLP